MLKEIAGHSGRIFGLLNIGDVHVWSCSWDASIMIWNAQVLRDKVERLFIEQ